jgi:hypothetical protein
MRDPFAMAFDQYVRTVRTVLTSDRLFTDDGRSGT